MIGCNTILQLLMSFARVFHRIFVEANDHIQWFFNNTQDTLQSYEAMTSQFIEDFYQKNLVWTRMT